MRFAVLFTLLALSVGSVAHGQIDPSSALLLNQTRTDVRESGIDTGRYTVKPRSDHKPRVHTEPKATPTPQPSTAAAAVTNSAASSATASAITATSVSTVVTTKTQTAPATSPSPTPAPQPAPPALQAQPSQPVAQPQATPEPTPSGPQSPVFSQSDDLVGPQAPAPTPVDERRVTMLELSFAPGYMYNDSKSTFAPRNYSVNAPTAMIDANIWTSPTFGVHTGFMSTLNANVSDSLDNTANASVSEQWFSAGVKARTFFGDDRKAPTLTFGLDYREFEFRTPSDTVFRNKLTTTGLVLTVDAEIPTGRFGAWQLGGDFGPALSHRESSTLYEVRSGVSPKTTSVGVHFGARYRFDHTNELFWKLSYGVEKNLFEGYTSVNDPVTGLPQTNVSVTNSFSMFQLGYSWGN